MSKKDRWVSGLLGAAMMCIGIWLTPEPVIITILGVGLISVGLGGLLIGIDG